MFDVKVLRNNNQEQEGYEIIVNEYERCHHCANETFVDSFRIKIPRLATKDVAAGYLRKLADAIEKGKFKENGQCEYRNLDEGRPSTKTGRCDSVCGREKDKK